MKMNLPNKITIVRLILSVIVLILIGIPWDQLGIYWPTILEIKTTPVELNFIIAGILFLIASVTDFLDGYIARSKNLVTDFGKVMDAIADKVLVNGVLIILAYNHMISVLIPVIIITRDTVVDSIKMASGNKGKVIAASWPGKIKTIFMLIGVTLSLFYNLPFEMFGIYLDEVIIIIATILSIYSGIQYYVANKDFIFNNK